MLNISRSSLCHLSGPLKENVPTPALARNKFGVRSGIHKVFDGSSDANLGRPFSL